MGVAPTLAALQQGEDSRRVRKILIAARYFSQKGKLIKVVCSLKFVILKKRVFPPLIFRVIRVFALDFRWIWNIQINDNFALYYLLSACNLIVLSEQLSAVCGRLEIDCFERCVSALLIAVCRLDTKVP